MRYLPELKVLLRTRVELKSGPKPKTVEVRETWNFFMGDTSNIDKKIRTGGWNFIKIPRGL